MIRAFSLRSSTALAAMLTVTGASASDMGGPFLWVAGDTTFFNAMPPPCVPSTSPVPATPSCPDAAIASSTGQRIDIAGLGMLTLHPKTINGGGTFFADALVLGGDPVLDGEGTWKAVELLSFKSYGPGDPPPFVLAGLAMIRIQLLVNETWVADAILTLGCILEGAKVPGVEGGVAGPGVRGGALEGVRVNVQDGLNFNLEVDPGATVFIDVTLAP